jgi:hypothetical protein
VPRATTIDEAKLLDGMLKAMSGEPIRAVGTKQAPGLFTGKPGEKLYEHAVERGLLEECEGPPPAAPKKGKKASAPAPHARITEAGRKWVLERTSPRQALEGIGEALLRQAEAFEASDAGGDVLQTQLADLQLSVDQAKQAVQEAATRQRENSSRVLEMLRSVGEAVGRLTSADAPSWEATPPASPSRLPAFLEEEAASFVRAWKQEKYVGCPLDELFRHLKSRSPELTIGAFHDMLRRLHETDRLRLSGWSGTLDRLPEPELALFIRHTLMYYADAREQSG